MEFLSTSQMPAEPRDHLVEYKDCSVLLAKISDSFQIAGGGRSHGLRLHQDASDLAWMLVHQLSQACKIVITELQGQIDCSLRNAGIHLRAADEPVIGGEERLVATNCDQIPPRIGPGELDGGCCYVGTVLGELHHVGSADDLKHRLSKIHFDLCGPIEVDTKLHLPISRLNDWFEGVSQGDSS